MLLVLGQPDSGCTTALRTLANQRSGYTRVDGDVTYGGIDHATFAKYFRGEAVYNQEDDVQLRTVDPLEESRPIVYIRLFQCNSYGQAL